MCIYEAGTFALSFTACGSPPAHMLLLWTFSMPPCPAWHWLGQLHSQNLPLLCPWDADSSWSSTFWKKSLSFQGSSCNPDPVSGSSPTEHWFQASTLLYRGSTDRLLSAWSISNRYVPNCHTQPKDLPWKSLPASSSSVTGLNLPRINKSLNSSSIQRRHKTLKRWKET